MPIDEFIMFLLAMMVLFFWVARCGRIDTGSAAYEAYCKENDYLHKRHPDVMPRNFQASLDWKEQALDSDIEKFTHYLDNVPAPPEVT